MPERWSALWERVAPWIVGVLLVVTVGAVWADLVLAKENYNSQIDHHAQTVKSNALQVRLLKDIEQSQADHNKTLNEVAALQKEVTKAYVQGSAALQAGQEQLVASLSWIECAISTSPTKCGPAPKI